MLLSVVECANARGWSGEVNTTTGRRVQLSGQAQRNRDNAIWRGSRSLSDEETLLALAAIGRCLWERTRRVRLSLVSSSDARTDRSHTDTSGFYKHAASRAATANQSNSTRIKMKHRENGVQFETLGTTGIDIDFYSAAPRIAGVMLLNSRLGAC